MNGTIPPPARCNLPGERGFTAAERDVMSDDGLGWACDQLPDDVISHWGHISSDTFVTGCAHCQAVAAHLRHTPFSNGGLGCDYCESWVSARRAFSDLVQPAPYIRFGSRWVGPDGLVGRVFAVGRDAATWLRAGDLVYAMWFGDHTTVKVQRAELLTLWRPASTGAAAQHSGKEQPDAS